MNSLNLFYSVNSFDSVQLVLFVSAGNLRCPVRCCKASPLLGPPDLRGSNTGTNLFSVVYFWGTASPNQKGKLLRGRATNYRWTQLAQRPGEGSHAPPPPPHLLPRKATLTQTHRSAGRIPCTPARSNLDRQVAIACAAFSHWCAIDFFLGVLRAAKNATGNPGRWLNLQAVINTSPQLLFGWALEERNPAT